MGNKVTFDYSKAVNVVREEEVAAMEKMVDAAKEVLVSYGFLCLNCYKTDGLRNQLLLLLPDKNRRYRLPGEHQSHSEFSVLLS